MKLQEAQASPALSTLSDTWQGFTEKKYTRGSGDTTKNPLFCRSPLAQLVPKFRGETKPLSSICRFHRSMLLMSCRFSAHQPQKPIPQPHTLGSVRRNFACHSGGQGRSYVGKASTWKSWRSELTLAAHMLELEVQALTRRSLARQLLLSCTHGFPCQSLTV